MAGKDSVKAGGVFGEGQYSGTGRAPRRARRANPPCRTDIPLGTRVALPPNNERTTAKVEGNTMFFGLDPIYFVFLAPGILLALWAQYRVQSAYNEASQIPARSGYSGAEAAQAVMEENRAHGVAIEPTEGVLTDHYVPG